MDEQTLKDILDVLKAGVTACEDAIAAPDDQEKQDACAEALQAICDTCDDALEGMDQGADVADNAARQAAKLPPAAA